MIAFGTLDHQARRLPAAAPSRASAAPPSRTRRSTARPAIGSIAAATTRCSTAPPRATTSRRSCSCTRTPRSSTPTCARRCARRCAIPRSALVGCVGAIDVRSIAWWEGSVTLASFVNRYDEHGGGDLASFSWSWEDAPPYAQTGEVETLDGFVLAFSPWAVRNVRFDESLGRFHGYDLDYCLQVREAGRKVVTADFRAIHHRAARDAPGPGGVDRGAHARRREVGRPHAAGRQRAGQLARARAARGGRARRRARAARTPRCVELEAARPRARARARRDAREHLVAADRAAAVGSAPRDDRLRLRRSSTPEAYRRYAGPGIRLRRRARLGGLRLSAVGSVCRSYNLLLDARGARATTSRRS